MRKGMKERGKNNNRRIVIFVNINSEGLERKHVNKTEKKYKKM